MLAPFSVILTAMCRYPSSTLFHNNSTFHTCFLLHVVSKRNSHVIENVTGAVHFKLGFTSNPTCEGCIEKDDILTCVMYFWGCSLLKIPSTGALLYGIRWLQIYPLRNILQFVQCVEFVERSKPKRCTLYDWWSRSKDPWRSILYSFIHLRRWCCSRSMLRVQKVDVLGCFAST
jgi:hypothetical protein